MRPDIGLPRTALVGRDIVVRPNCAEFAQYLGAAADESMATVGRWMTWCHPAIAEMEALEWYRSCERNWENGTEYEFSVFTQSGEFLGAVGLNQFNRANNFANLGYWIRESRQAQGYATQAARLLADFGLDALNLTRVEIVVAEANFPSRRVAEKVGGHFEGILRDRLLIHGHFHNAAMYSVTRRVGP